MELEENYLEEIRYRRKLRRLYKEYLRKNRVKFFVDRLKRYLKGMMKCMSKNQVNKMN